MSWTPRKVSTMKRDSTAPRWRLVALGLAISIGGAFCLVTLASAQPAGEPAPMGLMGPRGGPGMMGLPLGGPMLDRVLDQMQASDAQRQQLHSIADAARADLKPTLDADRADHERMVQLFAQPVVDPAAVETLRKRMVARHDTVTKRMNVAMLDAAKVLTAEQRQQMAEFAHAREARRAERLGSGAAAVH